MGRDFRRTPSTSCTDGLSVIQHNEHLSRFGLRLHELRHPARPRFLEAGIGRSLAGGNGVQDKLPSYEKHQPDIQNGRSIGMPLGQVTEEAYTGLGRRVIMGW